MPSTLTRRALARATLHRQFLLARRRVSVLEAVAHLAGLQGQEPDAPYLSLWCRLTDFNHDDLSALLHDRRVVRSSLLRGTQHLVTDDDFRWMRPLMQPVLSRIRQGAFGRATADLDLTEFVTVVEALLDGRTLTRPRLRDELVKRWPQYPPEALAYSAQALVPAVHPPPSGIWGKRGAIPFTLAEQWIGSPVTTSPEALEELIRRYLTAYGPATVKDVQAWCGLTRLREVAERMRPELRVFRDESSGATLYDVPDGPLPDPDTPAPARFLPEFDNLIVAYSDRTRLMTDDVRARVCVGAVITPTILVDGRVLGTWRIDGTALVVEPFAGLSDADREELTVEGGRLLDFAVPGNTPREVRFEPPR